MTGQKLLLIIIIVMLTLVGLSFRFYGYEATWRLWNIPTLMPPFTDLRLLPGSAESFREGFDPIYKNPGDPLGRHFNYPRAWYLVFYTGIQQDDTIWIGTLLALGFLFCVWIFPRHLDLVSAGLLALILFSPSTMLCLERGNVDLFIFILCTLALLALENSIWLSAGILMLAVILKLFPIFGFGIFLREVRSRFWAISLSAFALLLVYAALTYSNIAASFAYTEKGGDWSYGVNVVALQLRPFLSSEKMYSLLTFTLFLLALGLTVFGLFRGSRSKLLPTEDSRQFAAFRLGALVYIGTFFLGNNWDYRLIFLLFTVPQLYTWTSASRVVRWTLAALILSCWYLITLKIFGWLPYGIEFAYILDQISKWGLFAGLLFLFIRSAPDWLRIELMTVITRRVSKPRISKSAC